ncbi:hypothetical protein PLESTB_000861000 [Pleodorina starrii]|uniref:Uncharacterized protein n=1 Tax=Pleodorina starrii TaxID=330485 RepID=A0A9W6BM30_9CHLO|nr:hypothetical protein PLESTM_001433000 [Pleodorina starrii]GLC54413.1 hypothetical protein PLESTB_000861000 [Pleodorina starrii]GLC72065.1 hypothetical protein PLESTF_001200200 [Pleodorina starrii]
MSGRGRGRGRGGRSRRPETGGDGPAALDAAVTAATAPFTQQPSGRGFDFVDAEDSEDSSDEENGDVVTSPGEPQPNAGHVMLGSQGGAANLAAMFAAAAQGAAAHAPGRIPRRPRQTAAAAAAATGAVVAPLGVGILPIPGLLAQQQQQQLLLQQQQQQQRPASMDVMIEVEKPALRQAAGRSLVITDSTAIIVRGWTPNVGYQDPEELLVSLRLHIANSPDAILNAAKLNGFRPGEPSSVELRHPRRKRDAPMVVVTGEYLQQAITMAADNNEPIKLLWGSFPLPIPQPPLPQQQEPSEGTRATVSGGGGAKRGRTGRKSSDPLLVSTGKGMGMPSHMQQSAFQFPALDARPCSSYEGARL